VKNDSISIPLISSLLIHLAMFLLGSMMIHDSNLPRQDFLPISLVDLPRAEPTPIRKLEMPREEIKPQPKPEKRKEATKVIKKQPAKLEPLPTPSPALAKEEPPKVTETKPNPPEKIEPLPSLAPSARPEGGGSEAGAGNLFGKGDVGVVPGTGTAGGGGGTASAGLGRGSGAPGPPAQTVLKTNREARPIQTARASYPLMALRRGLEADVTLRIIVGPEGNVTRAEIVKSGGAGFDEEALKAVKQSRFEPAQREGRNVPAEFTYIFRFRLQR
jgi:periplasmic protein TonB